MLLVLGAGGALASGPTTQFSLSGDVTRPGSYTLSDLQGLPATTQTVSFLAGSGSQTHTYVGTSLWGLIDTAGVITGSAKNDIVSKYVLATGSDGYKVVYSVGEIDPTYGNRQDLVAYQEIVGGVPTPLGADGFARTTVPGDMRGSRYVSNLMNLDVRASGSTRTGTGGGAASGFTVSGAVVHDLSIDASTNWSALGLSPITRTVTYLAGAGSQTHTYTGYSFWDLLNSSAVGIVTDPAIKNDLVGKYVVATGSDGYKALYSMGELSPTYGGDPAIFIAVSETVGGVETGLGADGWARTVVPGDGRGSRYVSNLVNLEVFSAAPIPEPQAWALFGPGLGVVGVLARRARRRAAGHWIG